MNASIETKPTGHVALHITAAWAEVAADYDDLLEEYGRAPVPGFRQGRAPRAVIEKRLWNHLRSGLTARCGRRLSRQAIRDHNLRAVGPITVVEIRFEPRREFSFTAECVAVSPLDLPDWSAAALTATTDDERRDELSEWLLDRTAWEPPEPLIRLECARSGQAAAEAGSDAWQAAARRVKLMLTLEQIAETEGIETDERDADARLEKMAAESGLKPSELRCQLGEDGLSRLKSFLCAEQTLAYLLEQCGGNGDNREMSASSVAGP